MSRSAAGASGSGPDAHDAGDGWFSTLGFSGERTQPLTDRQGLATQPDTLGGASQAAPSAAVQGPRPQSRRKGNPPGTLREPPPSFQRMFRAFTIARALLGLLLLGMQAVLVLYLSGSSDWFTWGLCGAYALAALAVLAWPVPPVGYLGPTGHLRSRWALATLGVDLLVFTGLVIWVGPALNAVALYMLPVLMAATLMPQRHALGVASAVVLLLLASVGWQAPPGGGRIAPLMQVGIAGAGVMILAMLASQLSDRLARQERATRSTLELARQQARLNRLMIEEMQDGVMVVDRLGRVQAANPAALQLIGAPVARRFAPFELNLVTAWQPLSDALTLAYTTGQWPDGGQEMSLRLPVQTGQPERAPDSPTTEERPLRVRMRFTRQRDALSGEALCVLFLDDVRTLRARARQEKLAAMGRVSAGIAHEIRNPLAAIAQANALLAEDLEDPALQRLTRMVADNVVRLQRIVDDVAEVTPGAVREDVPVIDLRAEVTRLCADWARTAGVSTGEQSPLLVDGGGDQLLPVRFDIEHLRRVLVNLLDNALRHGSGQPQAVWVRLAARAGDQAELSVASDGEVIAPHVEPHLFEPFFSTRSRGSGLGLYICRELCERYGGQIEFRPRGAGARHRNVFVVTVPRWGSAQASSL